MLTKKFIFENDDEEEDDWSDYKNIMHLAKNRISPYRVTFETSDGKSFDDIIDVTHDGVIFTFDGLKDYLQFFFPEDYEGDSEGEYDAINYESMYYGNWNWYDDFYDRDSEDWREGYVTERLRKNHLELIRDISKTISPRLYTKLSKMLEEGTPLDSELNIEIRDFLAGFSVAGAAFSITLSLMIVLVPPDCFCWLVLLFSKLTLITGAAAACSVLVSSLDSPPPNNLVVINVPPAKIAVDNVPTKVFFKPDQPPSCCTVSSDMLFLFYYFTGDITIFCCKCNNI